MSFSVDRYRELKKSNHEWVSAVVERKSKITVDKVFVSIKTY